MTNSKFRYLLLSLALSGLPALAQPGPAKGGAGGGGKDAAPAPAAGGIQVALAWSTQDRGGRVYNVMRLTGQAPLPERARLDLDITYARNPHEVPQISKLAEVEKGRFELEIVDDETRFMPGEYHVAVRVSEQQRQSVRDRLTQEQWRLNGETRAVLGEAKQICSYVNKLAADVALHSRVIHQHFSELLQMLARASQKSLARPEWMAWRSGSPLGKSDNYLSLRFISEPANRALLPQTATKTRTFLVNDIGRLKSSIDAFLMPEEASTKEHIEEQKQAGSILQNAKDAKPSTTDLHAVLYHEGRSSYAAGAGAVFDAAEAVCAARKGKGAGNWDTLAAKWSKDLDELLALYDAFAGIEWMMEGVVLAQKNVELRETFALLKAHIDACGKSLLAPAPAGQEDPRLQSTREDLRRRLEALKKPTPT